MLLVLVYDGCVILLIISGKVKESLEGFIILDVNVFIWI